MSEVMGDEMSGTRPPVVVRRQEQPYVAIGRSVRMGGLAEVAHRLPEVIGWLRGQGLEPAGPPFFRYLTVDMAAELEVEAGVPVAVLPEPAGEITVGTLPAGHYATLNHVGRPDGLVEATRRLLDWAAGEGLEWDMTDEGGAQRWGCRMESYLTDPADEPDTAKWETELAFRLADLDRIGIS